MARRTPRRRQSNSAPLESLEGRVLFATFTWDGGGGDANWTTPANWSTDAAPAGDGTDSLVFPNGAAQLSNNNDFASGTDFASISFTAGGYTLAGNALDLGASGVSSSTGNNTISNNLTLLSDSTIGVSDGSTLAVSGNVNNAGHVLTVNPALGGSSVNFSGDISGTGSLTKTGSGSARFAGASTYAGGTTLSGGNTYANNPTGSAFGTGSVTNTSGTLRGNGSFSGALANNNSLSPGVTSGATGIIAPGNLTFGASGNINLNVNGTTPGTNFDQLNVTGTVDLDNGHPLNVSTSSYTATGGEKLFIIVNDGNDAVQGAFAGLEDPNVDTIGINGVDYNISYTGDSGSNSISGGNDVVLYVGGNNQPPINSVPGAQTTSEDTAKVFSAANGNAVTVSDPDAGLADVAVTLSVNTGATVTLPSASLITSGTNGSSSLTITGSISAVNAAMDGMSVAPAANSTSTITLSVVTSDLGNSGGGGAGTDSDSVSVGVSAVNDAPVNTVPGTQSAVQDVAKVFSSGNSNAISIADVDAGSNPVQVALTATNGTIQLSGTTGLTINSGGNGTGAITFTGTVIAINTALNGLSFTPTSGFTGAGSLQIITNDQGNTGTGGTLSDTDSVTINVAAAGSLGFSAATYSVAEDAGSGIATITVARTGGSAGAASIHYATSDGTATAGSDYTAASGTLNFADGETSKTFNVPLTDDTLDEDDETINLTLASASGASLGAQSSATLTITDNDATPSLSIGDVSIPEGNSGTSVANFTVTLSAASGRTVTVNYATADDTATAGSDYTATNGTLTFTPGQTTKTIPVTILGETTGEDNEIFTVVLSSPSNATVASGAGTGTIADDDSGGPTLSFASDVSITEGNTGTSNAVFTVNLIAGNGSTVTVDYSTVAGSATSGVDFVATSGTLTFTSGQTSKTVNIPVIGDTLDEDNEVFALVLSNPGNAGILDGSANATIIDNDAAPSVSISDATTAEGTGSPGSLDFAVSLSAASGKAVSVNFATADGTAIAGSDYAADSGSVTFAPGETVKMISVAAVADSTDESDETLGVSLSNVNNATVSDGQANGTITDDDAPPAVSIGDMSVAEPSAPGTANANFTVSLSQASGKTVSVNYATLGGTAVEGVDYVQSSGSLTFAPGETSKVVTVAVNFDGQPESDETFSLVLSNPVNMTIANSSATGTIQDTAPNTPPTAGDDSFLLAPGQAYVDLNVLANDGDADGDPLVTSIVSNSVNGTVSVNSDQTVRYTPNLGYAGADSFSYSISDGRGGTATASVVLSVPGNGVVIDPVNPKKQNLFLGATGGDDQIQIVKTGKQLRVTINGTEQGMFSANGNIVVSGGAGNDALVLRKVSQPVIFFGGDGNDILVAGSKGSILVGGAGEDNLVGGGGRDLIIGGDDADTISGLGGSDVLISGASSYDADTLANRQALSDLLTELASGHRYNDKLARLTSSSGVGSSGAKLVVNETVFDDGDADTITGGAAQDFYAANTDNNVIDVLVKKAKNETVIEL
jgi:hypothetical protein